MADPNNNSGAAPGVGAATAELPKKKEGISEEDPSNVSNALPPSHILPDGRFIYLPPPNDVERSRFFERSIAKYGLLESDMQGTADDATKDEEENKEKSTEPRVHPLAVASARLQASGVAELNRAINLSTLVNTGEYFGLTNIVDPALDLGVPTAPTTTATAATPNAQGSATPNTAATPNANTTDKATTDDGSKKPADPATPSTPANNKTAASQATKEMQEEQRVKAKYTLKRKRAVFDKMSRVLQRHCHRLQSAMSAQAIPDARLKQLRPQWRLVAPEHGTRAKPHAVRPTEVVAVDVDVYDPIGGVLGQSLAGRLASQVPRKKIKKEQDTASDITETATTTTTSSSQSSSQQSQTQSQQQPVWHKKFTMAEPFAIADPTLGKISADFDPNKVSFLTLQFDIEKPSTGFCMSSSLEPMTTSNIEEKQKHNAQGDLSGGAAAVVIKKEEQDDEPAVVKMEVDDDKKPKEEEKEEDEEEKKDDCDDDDNDKLPHDEQVLVSLQHSLFCAKLFESIRTEIMGDDLGDPDAQPKVQHHSQQATAQPSDSVMWLSSESEENYLPPPAVMVRPTGTGGAAALCVVHCHASEVKVQLDSEYTLRAKLVEAAERETTFSATANANTKTTTNVTSGSQSPEQLLVLCRSLLLHAQEAYHKHSLQESFKTAQKREEEEKRLLADANKPRGLDRIQKKDVRTKAKILQSVVALGTKMLFEQRIRKVLMRVRHWLQTKYPDTTDKISTEWLAVSVFDLHARFVISFGYSLTVDVTIVRDEMTVVTHNSLDWSSKAAGAVRKVKFRSDAEFEIFLKIEIRRAMKQQSQQ
ncbi:expressed unknown protein [Seminavis robusta]|uniref:Uncharacterized protein n=1 Tax=Seminavis robusta TaxID=568900 RepID=A0A9N8H7Y3_9STRA|nr:expressed unknown protein [Seminavis robusta]|eukprot:Sro198_g083990.1 n/a (817) ;mRNA; r:17890-20597